MKINVGSKNITKVEAVRETLKLYPEIFQKPEVFGVDVVDQIFGHPKNILEIVEGATARAQKCFGDCDFSFGIESGLIAVPRSKTGYFEIPVCVIYNGSEFFMGLGPAFEWPKAVTEMVLSGKTDASDAFRQVGLTQHKKLGALKGGVINFLTAGRLTREEQVRQSIISAMIPLIHSELYK